MDEVDGVGAGDRGGIQALIQIIKDAKTPVICICNDRQSTKIQSLANHCYDLKFQKPQSNLMVKRAQQICKKENIEIPEKQLNSMIGSSGQDLR